MRIRCARGDCVSRGSRFIAAVFVLMTLAPTRAPLAANPAAVGAHHAEITVEQLEQAVAARPDSVSAHLALGRAYYALGRFADAKIQFETVLRFDHLPPDLASQTRYYNKAAERYLDEDARLIGFDQVEIGLGRYWVNSTSDTGKSEPAQMFYLVNLAAALSYLFENGYELEADLDYGAQIFERSDTRNDSDLNWRAGLRRALEHGSVGFGLRGQVSYVGDGDYRKDYGAFADWDRELSQHDEISVETYIRRRQYPTGPLRDRSRTIAEVSGGWTHSLLDGAASVSLVIHGGYQYATRRPDGNSAFYGAFAQGDYTFNDHLDAFLSLEWERNRFNADQIHIHPDSLDEASILRRRDVLHEIGAGLAWEFASKWTLQPEVLYVHDSSNLDDFHYSSTEFRASVWTSF